MIKSYIRDKKFCNQELFNGQSKYAGIWCEWKSNITLREYIYMYIYIYIYTHFYFFIIVVLKKCLISGFGFAQE